MVIGVLALQGAVHEHIKMIESAGAEGVAVKRPEQLDELDGIIVPGGESTTIGKLMRTYGFIEGLKQFSREEKPIFGTCAGMIVLAKHIHGQTDGYLELMDMTVMRNAFGRQRESFEANLKIEGIGEDVRAVFIRAPLIEEVGTGVDVLAVCTGQIVAARQGHLLTTSFHPELTDDNRLHNYFVKMAEQYRTKTV